MSTEGDLTVYRSSAPVVDAHYDQEHDESINQVLTDALADAKGVDPVDLRPLYDFFDPEALSNQVDTHGEEFKADTIISSRFEKWNVFVHDDGLIRVCDGTQPTDPAPVFENFTA